MNSEILKAKIDNLVRANEVLCENVSANGDIKDLERIKSKLGETIEQLHFWYLQDNKERFFYDLKKHIQWMLKEFS